MGQRRCSSERSSTRSTTRAGSSCRRRSAATWPTGASSPSTTSCLGLWTDEGFADVAERLTEKVREGQAPQDAVRAFAANAHEVEPDSQGRIIIPQRLREFAGPERDVVVIGALERIEIWDASPLAGRRAPSATRA